MLNKSPQICPQDNLHGPSGNGHTPENGLPDIIIYNKRIYVSIYVKSPSAHLGGGGDNRSWI